MKEVYNYKQVFDDQIRIRHIWNITLPVAISLNRVLLWAFFCGFLYVGCEGLIARLNEIFGGARLVIYAVVPYYLSGKITAWNPDGQKLFVYLKDVLFYLVFIKLPKRAYCNEEIVTDQKPVLFEKIE